MRLFFLSGLLLILILVGCKETDQSQDKSPYMKLSTYEQYKQSTANEVKQKVSKRDEVSKVLVVNDDKNIVVGFEVDHHHRFTLAKIEEDIQKNIERLYPKHKVTVSTDQKIILELQELEKNIHQQNINRKQIQKRLKEIIELTTDEA